MQTLVAEVLAAWRRAERLTADLPPGTADHAAAADACARLRDLYRDLTGAGIPAPAAEADAKSFLSELERPR